MANNTDKNRKKNKGIAGKKKIEASLSSDTKLKIEMYYIFDDHTMVYLIPIYTTMKVSKEEKIQNILA